MRVTTIKCDRCGNLMTDVYFKPHTYRVGKPSKVVGDVCEYVGELKELELCDVCLDSLAEWFKGAQWLKETDEDDDITVNESPDINERKKKLWQLRK